MVNCLMTITAGKSVFEEIFSTAKHRHISIGDSWGRISVSKGQAKMIKNGLGAKLKTKTNWQKVLGFEQKQALFHSAIHLTSNYAMRKSKEMF